MEPVTNDDEELSLSGATLAALQSFYAERDSRTEQFEKLKDQAEKQAQDQNTDLDMDELFAEDWNASQFWYTKETATKLANELLADCTPDSKIAVVSAPSVFVALNNILKVSLKENTDQIVPSIALLEFDDRFEVFKEFYKYDYNKPLQLPAELRGKFDQIICDPPFLSEDCQTKAALTVQWLMKSGDEKHIVEESTNQAASEARTGGKACRIIVCTGERMEELIIRLYGRRGVRTTDFTIEHSKGLSNEFRCYANYEGQAWSWIGRPSSSVEEQP